MVGGQLILIVDDEPINLDLLETTLVGRGYRIARARDGKQALDRIRSLKPAAVVTDILMPNMDGYQLCRAIVGDSELRQIPVVFYTSTYTDQEDRDLAMQLGAAKFVVKPADPSSFQKVIAEVLDTRHHEPASEARVTAPDEPELLSHYNRRLVAKLEKKINELDKANRLLEEQFFRAQEAEREVREMALVDRVTDLPSRASVLLAMEKALQEIPELGFFHALLYVEVDSFREIDYAIGNERANHLLRGIGERLWETAAARGWIAARLGDDCFAVFMTDIPNDETLKNNTTVVATVFNRPFDVSGMRVDVTVSIGIALFPHHTNDPDLMLRHAGVALREAHGTRGLVVQYDPAEDPYEPGRVRLISGIRQAIRDDQLVVFYQPKITLEDRTTVGLEALVRWNHPKLGLLEPSAFVGMAEQTGLVKPLGRWLFRQVLREQERLRKEGNDLEVSVNLSTRNLMDPGLADEIMEEVAAQGLHRPSITIEITENSILKDLTQAKVTLDKLAAAGIEISVDDFGTGYSSLTHLRILPIRELKIDRSFITDMSAHEDDQRFVRSIISLAHALGLRVTAEGVEDGSSLEYLSQLGCDRAQGFHMARPMPIEDLRRWLVESPWGAGSSSSGR